MGLQAMVSAASRELAELRQQIPLKQGTPEHTDAQQRATDASVAFARLNVQILKLNNALKEDDFDTAASIKLEVETLEREKSCTVVLNVAAEAKAAAEPSTTGFPASSTTAGLPGRLGDEDWRVRYDAVVAVSRLDPTEIERDYREALEGMLEDENKGLTALVLQLLVDLKDKLQAMEFARRPMPLGTELREVLLDYY
jgi:hypothetical protein